MSHAERLTASAREVARLRQEHASDRHRDVLAEVKRWQSGRLARTHRDLLESARFGPAARFFLEDLYGAKDFSARDAALLKIVPTLARLLPEAALATVADAVEIDAMSERLDRELADRVLAAGNPGPLDDAGYAGAFRQTGSLAQRLHQIDLVVGVGVTLDRLVRHPLLGRLLHAMRHPARLAGVEPLHDFLVRGFDAFRSMKGASEFLAAIESRERAIATAIFAGQDQGWDGAAAPGGRTRPAGRARS